LLVVISNCCLHSCFIAAGTAGKCISANCLPCACHHIFRILQLGFADAANHYGTSWHFKCFLTSCMVVILGWCQGCLDKEHMKCLVYSQPIYSLKQKENWGKPLKHLANPGKWLLKRWVWKIQLKNMVRTVLALGYWVLSDIRRYWILDSIVIGGYLFIVTPSTIPIRQ